MNATLVKRIRLLEVLSYFYEKTDSAHAVSIDDLILYLESKGITVEKQALKRDIEALIEFGIDIKTCWIAGTKYYLKNRLLSQTQLLHIYDSVQCANLVVPSYKKTLLEDIRKLACVSQKNALSHTFFIPEESSYLTPVTYRRVNTLQKAIKEKKKIKIHTSKPKDGYRVYDEKNIIITPITVMFMNMASYLCAVSSTGELCKYKLERLAEIKILEEDGDDFSGSYSDFIFISKFPVITLLCNEQMLPVIITKYGDVFSVRRMSERMLEIKIPVKTDADFFEWIYSSNDQIKINKPQSISRKYESFVNRKKSGRIHISLRCHEDLRSEVEQKFPDISNRKRINYYTFENTVLTDIDTDFWGWILSQNGLVQISAPQSVVDEYKNMLHKNLNSKFSP